MSKRNFIEEGILMANKNKKRCSTPILIDFNAHLLQEQK